MRCNHDIEIQSVSYEIEGIKKNPSFYICRKCFCVFKPSDVENFIKEEAAND